MKKFRFANLAGAALLLLSVVALAVSTGPSSREMA